MSEESGEPSVMQTGGGAALVVRTGARGTVRRELEEEA